MVAVLLPVYVDNTGSIGSFFTGLILCLCCLQRLLRSPVSFMLGSLGCTFRFSGPCSSHGRAQHLEASVLLDVVWYRGAVLLPVLADVIPASASVSLHVSVDLPPESPDLGRCLLGSAFLECCLLHGA